MPSSTPDSPADYLIIGAGVNGTSIATTLASLGFSITLLDRSPDGFCAPDAASHDLNKIVRADYTDPNYCSLAKEAISLWRSHPVLKRYYHEVGVLFRSSDKGNVWGGSGSAEEYVKAGIEHAHLAKDEHLESGAKGKRAYKLESDKDVKKIMQMIKVGEGMKGFGQGQTGYFNPRGGWAEANNACRALLEHAIKLGVRVHGDARVVCFLRSSNGDVTGVKTADNRIFKAKQVVLAAGAWTSDLLTSLSPSPTPKWFTRPSAQCVAILKLSTIEAKTLAKTPVIINFSSGFYLFEPTKVGKEWQMKIAYHSNGYLYPKPPEECNGRHLAFTDSVVPTATTGTREIGAEGTSGTAGDVGYEMAEETIPANRLDEMLAELAQVYPHLAQRERVISTRVCWYSDTLDENWILDTLDHAEGLGGGKEGKVGSNVWVVSGDSGHAYKFLPLIGELFATIAGLKPNVRGLDLSRFTFAHQARLHKEKSEGREVKGADSNRFDPTKSQVQDNMRARL